MQVQFCKLKNKKISENVEKINILWYCNTSRKGEDEMYSSYGRGYGSRGFGLEDSGSLVWIIIATVVAVIGGIALYFTFLSQKNENKYTGFLGWMYDFLTFKKMIIENILRILYIITAIFITLSSFALISSSFLSFLLALIVGNILARVSYELLLVLLVICRNTTEINRKLKDSSKIVTQEPESKE